ncbi:MAG: hypothetical protein GXP30_07130 [Verrucomicrobia bacterium]|nr:hypothetical protein [Verrucomicrobiota bacterium]
MKHKKRIVIVSAIVVALAGWFYANPPGCFGFCTFACVTYGGIPRLISDLQVRSDGEIRKVEKTHDLKMENVRWLLESKPDILIIATGQDGVTQPSEKIENIQNCEIIILKTDEAVKLYNKLKDEKKSVAIHVHSTC